MDKSQNLNDGNARTKSLISKTLQCCRSLTWPSRRRNSVSPTGWVSVRVGPEKERFLVRAEWMNHRLFRQLLDEAETAYGYATNGPLELPCSVQIFHLVLWEMDQDAVDSGGAALPALCGYAASPACCGFVASPARGCRGGQPPGYRLISPSRVSAVSWF